MKKFFIGIDVSKEKLDFCLIQGEQIMTELVIENDCCTIKRKLQELILEHLIPTQKLLLCAEHTGQYVYPLCCACMELSIDFWLEDPTRIKYRSGVYRGKNDKLDAQKIAFYAMRFQDDKRLFSLPEKTICSLKELISERNLFVVDKAKYQGQLTDQKRFMDKNDYLRKSMRIQRLIDELKKAIEEIEAIIEELIKSEETLSNQYRLLCSVDGIGKKTALKMIVETNAFKNFKDPRKFCCHAGVAPFIYTSGSSIRSKNKVSNRADKSIKALLHMAALSVATRKDGELSRYYQRKVAEGKNKMSVLNAIRAKLVHRMFAVIKNNKLYEKNYINTLA